MINGVDDKINATAVDSLVGLANATELISNLVLAVAGNDISDSLKDSQINGSLIKTMVQKRIIESLRGTL